MTTKDMQVPAHIAARIAARQQAGKRSALVEALSGAPQPPRISIKASRFRLVENDVETVVGPELDVVIVGANPKVSKVFFANEYDPDADNLRPDCASADGMHPDADVDSPVCDSCAKCPNNVLGSKINKSGAKSKLCSDVRYLAVVPAADPSKVYALNVSVTAMKPLRQYVQGLANYGIAPEEVVTKLGFDDNASYPLLTFTQGRFLPEKALDAIDDITTGEAVKIATHADTQPRLPAPAAASAETNVAQLEEKRAEKAAKKAAPAQTFPGEEEEEVEVEEKKPTKPAAKRAKKAEPEPEVVEEGTDETSELEAALDDIFG